MNNKAFTLVELLAVIIILGLISTIGITSYNKIIENSKDKAFSSYKNTVETIIQSKVIDDYTSGNSTLKKYSINSDCDLFHNNDDKSCKYSLKKLIDDGLIDSFSDYDCDNDSYIEVMVYSSNKTEYNVCLICNNLKNPNKYCS